MLGPLCARFRIPPHLIRVTVRLLTADVRVGTDLLPNRAAQQIVHRPVQILAHNVPAGHFDCTQNPHPREIRMMAVAVRVTSLEQRFDVIRVLSNRQVLSEIADHRLQYSRTERNSQRVHLAVAGKVRLICQHLHEHPGVSRLRCGRNLYRNRFHTGDRHTAAAIAHILCPA